MALPSFSLEKPKYDQSSYWGRVRRFQEMVNPMMVFISSKRISSSVDLLEQFRIGKLPPAVTTAQLWEARAVKEATVHPDTKQIIPVPFRMSFFVFANVPICCGMILAAPTMTNIVFWQWVNQTYNAAFNYANRNATVANDMSGIAKSYAAATSVAVGVAVGLDQLVKRATNMSPGLRGFVQKTVPYTAVALAGSCNAILMRYKEAFDGIEVIDAEGKTRGKSTVAGRMALMQVAATRVMLPLPILMLPPYIIAFMNKTALVKANPRLKLPIELLVISAMIMGALPMAIGLFPQTVTVATSSLEPEFQSLTDSRGRAVTELTYNKGL